VLVFAELISSTLKMEAICSSEISVDIQRLHCVMSQKMIFFKVSDVTVGECTSQSINGCDKCNANLWSHS
jgi:hypothetical protein